MVLGIVSAPRDPVELRVGEFDRVRARRGGRPGRGSGARHGTRER